MKKKTVYIIVICILVIATVSTVFLVRKYNYNYGKEQGYFIGYSIGYTDQLKQERQDSQILAGELVPYEVGNSKWKGFMIGFPNGYEDGYTNAFGE